MILIFIMIITCFTAAVYTIDEVELHLNAHKFSDFSLKQSIFNIMTTFINFRHPIVLVVGEIGVEQDSSTSSSQFSWS